MNFDYTSIDFDFKGDKVYTFLKNIVSWQDKEIDVDGFKKKVCVVRLVDGTNAFDEAMDAKAFKDAIDNVVGNVKHTTI